MVNLGVNDLAAFISRVEAIAFGQEMLQRPALRGKDLADGAILALQICGRCSAMRSLAFVLTPAVPVCAAHSSSKIRQVKPRPRNGNSQRIARVQAEKPHPGLSFASHISPDIQFRKCRETWHGRRPT